MLKRMNGGRGQKDGVKFVARLILFTIQPKVH